MTRHLDCRCSETLAEHYASGDLFVFPSQTETFDNVTLEAMASGLAVVSYDLAAAHELIVHGRNGLIADPSRDTAFIDLARPCEAFPDIHRHAPMLDLYSFPSSHTMHAVGFTAVIAGHYPALGILIAPFALVVAWSRLVLGLHYPSDVAIGTMIGGSVAWSSFVLLA